MEMITTLLRYILLYAIIMSGSIFISNITKKRIERSIIIYFLSIFVIIYLFGLVNLLIIGVWIVSILSLMLGLIAIIRNRKNNQFKENICTNGLYFFTIVYFIFIIFTFNKLSDLWDEFSYWSAISKNMFYTNKLVDNVQYFCTLYPPFPTIWQYFCNKVIGAYKPGIEIFANIILGISILLPLFEKVDKDKKIPNICVSIIIICIPVIFNYMIFYQAIYVDCILGLLIGYTIYQTYNEKDSKFLVLSLTLALIAISLTKSIGIYISIILIILYILKNTIYMIRNSRKNIKGYLKDNKKTIIAVLIITVIVLIIYSFWMIYPKELKNDKLELGDYAQQEEHISITEGVKTIFTTIFGSNDNTIDYDLSNRLLFSALYQQKAIANPVNIDLMTFIILSIIGAILIYKYWIKAEEKEKYVSTVISIFIGLAMYIAMIQLAYITQFSINESIKHASLERYINTYLIGILVFFISVIISKIKSSEKNKNYKYIFLTLIILLITPINTIIDSTIASGNNNAVTRCSLSSVIYQSERLKENLTSEDNVYLINQESDLYATSWKIKYFALPELKINNTTKISEDLKNKLNNQDMFNLFEKILYEKYDYLYIYKTDEYFNEFAKKLFDENTQIKEKFIYKIQKEDDETIKLIEYKDCNIVE